MKICLPILLGTALIILTACPYSSPYRLDDKPQQAIDDQLLGRWVTMVKKVETDKIQRTEPVEIIFTRKTDSIYNIDITGKISELKRCNVISNDTIRATGFISTVLKKQILNVCIGNEVYLAELRKDTNDISLLPITENFTAKYIKSNEVLRLALELHYRLNAEASYDQDFSLRDLRKKE